MAKVRAEIGKQISAISRPQILTARDVRFEAPDILDAFQCQIYDSVSIFGGGVKLSHALIPDSIPSGEIPIIGCAFSLNVNPSIGMEVLSLNDDALVQTPKIEDAVVGFCLLAEISDCFDLAITPAVQIFEASVFYDIQSVGGIKILGNLLELIKVEKILGMNYSDRHWQVELVNSGERGDDVGGSRGRSNGGRVPKPIPPKPLKNNGKKRPSIWDLIFVVLQPPLTLAQTENLFLPHSLYPYQVYGIEFLLRNEHALLADDMGTGKTVMTTVALKILLRQARVHHTLILCPPSVLHEWRRHLDEWASELVTYFVRGGQDTRELIWEMPFHIYVTAYDTLARDLESGRLSQDMLEYFDVVVLDEAHHIKNPNSRRSRAVKKLKPKIRWALTGTPIQNKLGVC